MVGISDNVLAVTITGSTWASLSIKLAALLLVQSGVEELEVCLDMEATNWSATASLDMLNTHSLRRRAWKFRSGLS